MLIRLMGSFQSARSGKKDVKEIKNRCFSGQKTRPECVLGNTRVWGVFAYASFTQT